MRLRNVTIHKYKSFESDQQFDLEDNISIMVGMNESGKTAALEAIAKTNYFQKDEKFKFNLTHDFPRKEKKKIDKSGENPKAITCTYEIPDTLKNEIENELGKGILKSKEFTVSYKYKGEERSFEGISADKNKFIQNITNKLNISSGSLNEKLSKVKSKEEFDEFKSTYKDNSYIEAFKELKKYFKNEWDFQNPIEEYIAREYLDKNLPKFLYYDEYFLLPSRISIEKIANNNFDKHEENDYKTAKALFDLANIDTSELLKAEDFEDYIAELEATEAIISSELFKYWQTNKNLQITFRIDKKEKTDRQSNKKIVEHVLDVRVRNKNKGVSLPLKNRSKGFNWFFSFLVWFKKIQEETDSQIILLLDEPGLHLHASAQEDLLNFIEDLSSDYQIIYTTHSPFMISSEKLNRVRTILETDNGSVISESLQEKDPNTLFPLQAALGYDIAQNLFVSKKNLLVEGVSDLIILTSISGILEAEGRISLREDITIVPTGGLDKVATFISLLRGSKLELVCLLDSFIDSKGKAKLDNVISEKIIHRNKIRFFDEFLDGYSRADLEDLFVKSDYLKLFNSAFKEYNDIEEKDLNPNIQNIIIQINQYIGKERFNHYRPANELVKAGVDKTYFHQDTLDSFEKVFKEINKLFK